MWVLHCHSVWLLFLAPGSVVSEEYVTEYSVDKIEMHEGAIKLGQRVLLVDDLIATGGTLRECNMCTHCSFTCLMHLIAMLDIQCFGIAP